MPLVPPYGRNQNIHQGEKYDEETIFKRSDSVGSVPDPAAHGITGGGNSAQLRNACRDRSANRQVLYPEDRRRDQRNHGFA